MAEKATQKTLPEFFGQAYDGAFSGRVIFDAIHPKEPNSVDVKRVGCCTTKEILEFTAKAKNCKEDRYVTANSFCGHRRKSQYLFSLHNLVIDVDCHDKSLSSHEIKVLIEKFLYYLNRDLVSLGEFPAPSLVNWTGRGVHLWINFEQCSSKLIHIYKSVAASLVKKIKRLLDEYPEELYGINIDPGASGRAAGLYRIPGSYHSKTGEYGTYEIFSNRYTLPALYEQYAKYEQRAKIEQKPAPVFRGRNISPNSFYLANKRRKELVEGLIKDRDKNIGEETRNLLMLVYYNACVQLMPREEARQKLMVLNQKFKAQMEEYKHIIDYIDTVRNFLGDEGYLPFKNSTLIEFLGLSNEEREKYKIGYAPRMRIQNETRDTTRKETREEKHQRIRQLYENGMELQKIAEEVGCHRNTVSKVLNHTEETKKKRSDLVVQVQKMRRKKMKQREIAETLGISIHSVKEICKKGGVC